MQCDIDTGISSFYCYPICTVMPLREEEFAAVQLPKDSPLSTSTLLVPPPDADEPQNSDGSSSNSGIEVVATPEEYETAEEVFVPTAPVDPSLTLPPFGRAL